MLLECMQIICLQYGDDDWCHGATPAQSCRYSTRVQVEAIMGAFFMAGGTEQTSDFLRRILLLPEDTRHAPPRSPPPYQPPAMGMAS